MEKFRNHIRWKVFVGDVCAVTSSSQEFFSLYKTFSRRESGLSSPSPHLHPTHVPNQGESLWSLLELLVYTVMQNESINRRWLR